MTERHYKDALLQEGETRDVTSNAIIIRSHASSSYKALHTFLSQ